MNIEEIRKQYTRKEFLENAKLKWMGKVNTQKSCPKSYNLKALDCINDDNITICEATCKECWEQAVKGIKFKDDILMVECIDNKGYENELILGKRYSVLEESKEHYYIEDKWFNDKVGYKKRRFKPVEKAINYEAEYNQLKSKLEVSQSALNIVKKHVETYEKEYDKLKEENEKLVKANLEIQDSNLKYFNDAKDLKRENEKISQEFQEEITNLNNELGQVKFENKELISRNENQKSNISSMLEDIEMLKQMYADKALFLNKNPEEPEIKNKDLEIETLKEMIKKLVKFI